MKDGVRSGVVGGDEIDGIASVLLVGKIFCVAGQRKKKRTGGKVVIASP